MYLCVCMWIKYVCMLKPKTLYECIYVYMYVCIYCIYSYSDVNISLNLGQGCKWTDRQQVRAVESSWGQEPKEKRAKFHVHLETNIILLIIWFCLLIVLQNNIEVSLLLIWSQDVNSFFFLICMYFVNVVLKCWNRRVGVVESLLKIKFISIDE